MPLGNQKKKKQDYEDEDEEGETMADENYLKKLQDPRPPYWRFSDIFVNIDLYGVSPSLEIRGKREYKTCWGAFISLIVILLLIAYIILQVLNLLLTIDYVQFQVLAAQEQIGYFIYDPTQPTVGSPSSFLGSLLNSIARIGGFYVSVHYFFGGFVNCINQKLYLRSLIQDTYLMHQNNDFLGLKAKKSNNQSGNQNQKKQTKNTKQSQNKKQDKATAQTKGQSNKQKLKKLESVAEEDFEEDQEGRDKSNYNSIQEGGYQEKDRISDHELNQYSNTITESLESLQIQNNIQTATQSRTQRISQEFQTQKRDQDFRNNFKDYLSQKQNTISKRSLLKNQDAMSYDQDEYNKLPIKKSPIKKIREIQNTNYEGGSKNGSKGQQHQRHKSANLEIYDYDDQRSQGTVKSKESLMRSQRSHGIKSQQNNQNVSMLSKGSKNSKKYENESEKKTKEKQNSRSATQQDESFREANNANEFIKIDVHGFSILRLICTPICCRTRFLKSLQRLFKKAEYRLHSELDIGVLLKNIRDSKSAVQSYSTSQVFDPPKLIQRYQTEYANVIQISIDTEESIEKQYALPIPVDYIEPSPVCVCPDLGEDNLVKIAETAYKILKSEKDLNMKLEEQMKLRKALKAEGQEMEGQKASTMEGGEGDRESKRDQKSILDKSKLAVEINKSVKNSEMNKSTNDKSANKVNQNVEKIETQVQQANDEKISQKSKFEGHLKSIILSQKDKIQQSQKKEEQDLTPRQTPNIQEQQSRVSEKNNQQAIVAKEEPVRKESKKSKKDKERRKSSRKKSTAKKEDNNIVINPFMQS